MKRLSNASCVDAIVRVSKLLVEDAEGVHVELLTFWPFDLFLTWSFLYMFKMIISTTVKRQTSN